MVLHFGEEKRDVKNGGIKKGWRLIVSWVEDLKEKSSFPLNVSELNSPLIRQLIKLV